MTDRPSSLCQHIKYHGCNTAYSNICITFAMQWLKFNHLCECNVSAQSMCSQTGLFKCCFIVDATLCCTFVCPQVDDVQNWEGICLSLSQSCDVDSPAPWPFILTCGGGESMQVDPWCVKNKRLWCVCPGKQLDQTLEWAKVMYRSIILENTLVLVSERGNLANHFNMSTLKLYENIKYFH